MHKLIVQEIIQHLLKLNLSIKLNSTHKHNFVTPFKKQYF